MALEFSDVSLKIPCCACLHNHSTRFFRIAECGFKFEKGHSGGKKDHTTMIAIPTFHFCESCYEAVKGKEKMMERLVVFSLLIFERAVNKPYDMKMIEDIVKINKEIERRNGGDHL